MPQDAYVAELAESIVYYEGTLAGTQEEYKSSTNYKGGEKSDPRQIQPDTDRSKRKEIGDGGG